MVARFLPLFVSVVFAALIAVLVMTPLAWHLSGSPAESYPELLYLAYGAPPALILLIASAVIALWGTPKLGGPLRPALRPLWLCMAVSVLLTSLLLTPARNIIPEGAGQAIVDLTFYAAWPGLAVWVIAASIWVWTRPRSAVPA